MIDATSATIAACSAAVGAAAKTLWGTYKERKDAGRERDAQEHNQAQERDAPFRQLYEEERTENRKLNNRMFDLVARDSAHAKAIQHLTEKIEDGEVKFKETEIRLNDCESDRIDLRTRISELEKRFENPID